MPKQLINWLLDGDSPLKVISVEGMGGLGKTTLVKKVYEDKKVKRHFQNHAWITVSQYVLVLDDVWSVDVWDAIKIALPNSNCGSRVLLTMRIGNVASISCREFNGYIHKMEALSKEESWTLFCKKTFQEKDCPPHLKELSESIPQRCEGLPLAIVAIARVLASKDHGRANGWDFVNRSIGAEVEGNYMTKIFLPKNHMIEWMSSIRLWIAEGFVEVKQGKTPEEVALYELLNRSLMQVAEKRHDGVSKDIPEVIKLFHLRSSWSKLKDDLLQSLQYLPNLIRLTMGQDAYEREGLCFKASGFQRLKFLSLGRLEGLRRLTVEKGTMPRLEELFIYSCNLVELPFGIEHLSNLNNLTLSDMPDTLIVKLNPEKQSEDYWKIAHIRLLWIGDSKDGHWRGDYL
ncbi:unnamed protein product [Camellia sinensis]